MNLSSTLSSGNHLPSTFRYVQKPRSVWSARLRQVAGVLALGAATLAHATDRWVPENWFTSPVFERAVVADRVTEAPNGQLYVSFSNGAAIDAVRGVGQFGALMRLNSNGALDDSFSIGSVLTDVWAVAFQDNGQIIAGGLAGAESHQTGLPLYRVFRFNTDGSLDDSFQSPVFRDIPRFITVLGDDSMLVVPSSGNSGNGGIAILAHLNADGSPRDGFTEPNLGGGVIFAPPVVDGSGKIYIGGIFGEVNGQARPGVARLNGDGSLDTTFVPAGFNPDGPPQQVRGIGLQTQGANAGKVIIAGGTMVVPSSSDPSANRPLIRLNNNGSLDSTFNLTTQADAGMYVRPRLLEVLSDDSLVIVGGGVARFSADGVQFAPEVYARPYFNQEFFWMEALADGSVIVASQLNSTINDEGWPSLAKFLPSGEIDPDFVLTEFTQRVYPGDFHTYDDGSFLVWGNFDTVNGEERAGIVRFDNAGNIDTGFTVADLAAPNYVTSAGVSDSGRVLATTYNPFSFESSVRVLDGSGADDTGFTLDAGLGDNLGGIDAHLYRDDSMLLMGLNPQRLIDDALLLERLTPTGALSDTFDSSSLATPGAVYRNPDDTVETITIGHFNVLAEDDQGRLIVATTTGSYGQRASTLDTTLIRLNGNGTIDNTFVAPVLAWTTSTGFPFVYDAAVDAVRQIESTAVGSPFQGVEIQDDGKLLIYGLFTELAGQFSPGLARLNADGSFDSSFSVGSGAAYNAVPDRVGQVTGVHRGGDGRIWVAGYFDTFNGVAASGLIQLEADGSPVNGFSAELELRPYNGGNIDVQDLEWDTNVLVGGTFARGPWQVFPDAFQRLAQVPLVNVYAPPLNTTLAAGVPGVLRVGYTDPQDAVTLQWFRNGEAILGANSPELHLAGDAESEGTYQLLISGSSETQWTNAVEVRLGPGGSTWYADPAFTSPGFFSDRQAGRVTVDPNGGYYGTWVNGSFLSGADGVTTGPIVKVDDNGAVVSTFNTGDALNEAWAVVPLDDGSLLVGGVASTESSLSGQKLYRVFKFSATGELDPSYRSPVFGGLPRFMTLQPDGKLIVVPTGNNGANGGIRWIARLNADGSLDNSFHQVWLNQVIFAPPVVDPDTGQIYIGGSFWEVDGVWRPGIARLNDDGTHDTDWAPSGYTPSPNGQQIRGLALQTQGANAGKLLVAGGPLPVPDGQGGEIDTPVMRLNADGSLDTSFTYVSQATAGMNPRPRLLHLLANDQFLVVGATVTRFLADGGVDPDYTQPPFDAEAFWFAVEADGTVIVPPEPYTNLDGNPVWRWVRLNPNGTHDTGFSGPQFELINFPFRFLPLADGDILTFGGFTKVDGNYLPGIVRMNSDGSVDPGFSTPSITLPNAVVFAELTPDGGILATTSNSATGERDTVKLFADGTLDTSFTVDSAIGPGSYETKVLSDNSVLVWGVDAQRVIDGSDGFGHLTSTGVLDESFGPEGNRPPLGAVYRNGDGSISSVTVGNFRVLAVDSVGRYLARSTVGEHYQGTQYLPNTIIRYLADGTVDPTFNAPLLWWSTFRSYPTVVDAQTNNGAPGQVEANIAYTPFAGAVPQADGKVIVYGYFQFIDGIYTPGIARLNADGSLDTSFNVGFGATFLAEPGRAGSVTAVNPAGNGQFWVTGFFDSFNGHASPGIALLNGDGSVDTRFATDIEFRPFFASGMNAQTVADGSLVVAGSYGAYGAATQAFHRLLPPVGFAANLPPVTEFAGNTTVTLDGTVAGADGVTYQWSKDGVELNGATDPVLTLSGLTAADAGVYSLIASFDGQSLFTSTTLAMIGGDTGPGPIHNVGDLAGGDISAQVRDAVLIDGVIHAVGTSVARIPAGFDAIGDTGIYWRSDEGLYALPNIEPASEGFQFVVASAMTPDAAYISTRSRADLGELRVPTRVSTADFGIDELSRATDFGDYGSGTSISDDGNVVTGFYRNDQGNFRGFYTYVDTGEVVTIEPTNPAFDETIAAGGRGISADGSVIVGFMTDYDGNAGQRGFRYVVGVGLTELPLLPGGTWAQAVGVSADGVTTVLRGDSAEYPNGEIYLHHADTGAVESLGSPGVNMYTLNIFSPAADLSVISLAFRDVDTNQGEVYIRNANGWFPLREAVESLNEPLDGWEFWTGFGVSRDARLVFGNGAQHGTRAGFVVEFPAGYLADFAGVDAAPNFAWRNPLPRGGTLLSVIHDGTQFVAGGTGSRITESADGINWIDTAILPEEQVNALAFNGSTYVAVGGGGAIYTSTDRSNWTLAARDANYRWLFGVAFGGDRFVTVGDSGSAYVSTDGGANWQATSTGTSQQLRSISSDGGVFVAVGNGLILRSTDGFAWSPVAVPSGLEFEAFNSVKYLQGQFVIVGGSGVVLTSSDGTTWTEHRVPNYDWLTGVTVVDGDILVVTGSAQAQRTSDFSSWMRFETTYSSPMTNFNDVTSAGGVTVAVGSGGVIRRSIDGGATWSDTGAINTINEFNDIAWIDGQFLAAGSSGVIFASADGRDWWQVNSNSASWLQAIGHGNGRTVIAAGWGHVLTTDEAGNWFETNLDDGIDNRDVVFHEGTFYMVGHNGTWRESTDGVNWSTSQIPGIGQNLVSVAFGGGAAVVVGDGGLILRSTDGVNWSDVSTGQGWNLLKVRWIDGQFVATGDNRSVLLSADGVEWRQAPVPNDYFNFGWSYQDVAKGSDAYYVVSSQGRVLRTTNWTDWTQYGAFPVKPNLKGLAFGAGRMVVVGEGGAILTTTSAPTAPELAFPQGGLPGQIDFANGGRASLAIFVTGEGPLSFSWQKDGETIPGATTSVLNLSDLSGADAGVYTVIVTGPGGATIESSTTLAVAGLGSGNGPIFAVGDVPGGSFYSQIRDAALVDGVLHAVGTSSGVAVDAGDTNIYWRSDLGLTVVPNLEPASTGSAFVTGSALSADAAYIATRTRANLGNYRLAARVATADFAIDVLPDGDNFGGYSAAVAISDDGGIVAGFFFTATGGYNTFYTDVAAGSTTTIGPISGDFDRAFVAGGRGLSADGSVLVGDMVDTSGTVPERAYRHVVGEGSTLIPLPTGGTWNSGIAVSGDGLTTLVAGDSASAPLGEVYLHHATTDSLESLGTPDDTRVPNSIFGMSADAAVVVVAFYDENFADGRTWVRNQHGWFPLDEAIVALSGSLDGWHFDNGMGVSRDGTLVFGSGLRNGVREGFVVQFPIGYLASFAGNVGPIYGIGDLSGGDVLSEVRDATLVDGVIHAVGTSIAGAEPGSGSVGDTGVYWNSVTGLEAFPELSPDHSGLTFVTASAITPDAAFVATRSRTQFFNQRVATRIATADFAIDRLPDGADFGGYSAATSISDDGNILGGFYYTSGQSFRGFVTDLSGPGTSSIEPVSADFEDVFVAGGRGLSADGSVVVGQMVDYDVERGARAFRHVVGGSTELLPLTPGGVWNDAVAVSADGLTTLVRGDSTAFPSGELYLHHAGTGTIESLGSPDPDMYPLNLIGMTGDASVVVASFYQNGTNIGGTFVHNSNGWFSLQEAVLGLGAGLGGWSFDGGLGISRDGRVVFGGGTRFGGPEQGFVVEFPAGYLAAFEPQPPLEGPEDDDAIVGAWTTGAGNEDFVIVFDRDGGYVHIEVVPQGTVGAQSGYERGHYAWAADGGFRVATDVDTNGDVGVADLTGRQDLTIAVVGDTLTFTIPGDEVVVLQRVTDETNPIVGAWNLNQSPESGVDGDAVLVLMADGKFLFAEENEADEDGQSGIERGSFTWNGETAAFSAFNFDTDTNGTWGLSHPDGQTFVSIIDYGWTLNYSDDFGGGTFNRIAPEPVDIQTGPTGGIYTAGDGLTLSVQAGGDGPFTYQWRKDGVEIAGATSSSFSIAELTEDDAGVYDVAITGPDGTSLSDPAVVSVDPAAPPARVLSSASANFILNDGEMAALPFRIEGNGDKQLLLRVVGPSLGSFGISGAHPDPRLRLVDELGFEVMANDDWDAAGGSAVSTAGTAVGALPLGTGSADAAVVALLPPGSYTLLIDGVGSGTVFGEIFDVDGPAATSRLVYLGAATHMGAGAGLQLGFPVNGTDPTDLLLRVLGPSLGFAAAVADPSLAVDQGGTPVFSNDNWGGTTDLTAAFDAAGATMLDPASLDAAVLESFAPGVYSVTAAGGSGLQLTEIFDVNRREPIGEPVLLLPPQSQTVGEGGTARIEAYATSSSTLAYQWFKGAIELTGETSPVLEITGVSPSDAGDYILKLTDSSGTVSAAPATLTVLSGPAITTGPADTTVESGATATLSVVATSSAGGAISYQWYTGTSGDTSSPVADATAASFTTAALSTTTSYWVRVTDDIGSANSATATVTVLAASDVVASHNLIGSGFQPGGTVTIETHVSFTGPASTYGWRVQLPEGWSYASTSGEFRPDVRPSIGATGEIGWAYTELPPSPVTFTYTLNVPESASEPVALTAVVLFRDGINPEQQIVVTPSPLIIEQAAPFHSADSNQDGAFDLSELLRVIELYNTRNGTTRTGHYKVQAGTEDGFASNPDLTNNESGNLSVFHSADYDQNGQLDLSELLRVIELYNYRSGTTRTGEYHPASGTEDGYAPGPEPTS